jgi:hypothetical protein
LAYRFWITGAFAGFTEEDWRQNDKWFDVKLMVDTYGNDFEKLMCNHSYGRVLKGILESLNLQSDKLLHLGQNLGSKSLDLMEEECEAIRRMGNWNLGVFDTSYGSKIPLGPIRKLAEYLLAKRMFFNTRTTVEPSDQLLRLTPFGWVYDAFDSIEGSVGSNHMAFQVLKFFKELNRILMQDVAATLILYPERGTHAFFQMPFLKTVNFRVSTSVVGCCVVGTSVSFFHFCSTGLQSTYGGAPYRRGLSIGRYAGDYIAWSAYSVCSYRRKYRNGLGRGADGVSAGERKYWYFG